MPLYDYKCSSCARVTEVRHGFDESNSQVCPSCGGALRRVFNAAPILFKGSGFYINDSRPKSTGDSAAASDSKSPDVKPGEASPLPTAKEVPGSAPSEAGGSSAPPAPTPAPSESKPGTAA